MNENPWINPETEGKLKKDAPEFANWDVKNGTDFYPQKKSVEGLPPGYYTPSFDEGRQIPFMQKKTAVCPKLYNMPNNLHETIMNDITHFWNSKEKYDRFGNVYKRNILIYSVPGTGKTSLINLLVQDLINKRHGIVIQINCGIELRFYVMCMSFLRVIEPDRKIITIMEDFDSYIDEYESYLLQILDGNAQFENVVTIATTNYPEKIKEKFVNRPSRFNFVVEYKKPDQKNRKFYIENKLADAGYDVKEKKLKAQIEHFAKISKGYSMDHLKELIQGIYVDDIPEEKVLERINKMIKKNGHFKNSENLSEGDKIGFNSTGDEPNEPDEDGEHTEKDDASTPKIHKVGF